MTPVLTFERDAHVYTVDGDRYPSVTGILQHHRLIDFDHLPSHVRDSALRRGTAVHQAVHYFNDDDFDVDRFYADFPDYAPYLSAWIDFRSQRAFRPVLSEHRVASTRHRVAGTLDCLGVLDGRAVLLDFKTGDPADVASDLQTAGYLMLARDWAEYDAPLAAFLRVHPTVDRCAVQLRRDGTFKVEPYGAHTDAREFVALVTAYHIVARRRAVVESEGA